jgi:hypothetical protein
MGIAKHCCFILSLIFTMPAFSQTQAGTINAKDSLISTESMHVHFDKDIYLPGEMIWFKAYLYNVNESSFTGTNFYVAIYDEKGKLLQQKQYPVFEGSCNGDFEIPDTIQSTRLQFRAFTKAMIVNDSNNVYDKILTVYNKENNTDSVIANKTIDLQFFPEGGQMIAELDNHIAFKAVYSDGSPAMIKGQIIQVQRNILIDTLDAFSTNNLGFGKFVLAALPYKNYIAVWKDENGITRQTPLPEVSRYGVSFHAVIINKELRYTLAKNKSSDSLSILHLLAQMGNYQVYKATLVIPNEMELVTAIFPIDSVPAGLMQLTLFDKGWNQLQQRLVFINDSTINQQPLVTTDTINTRPKGKNTVEITLTDTMFTNLSASVADINFYDQPGTHSIRQDLWFNTQLKNLDQNLDLLLNAGNSNAIDLMTLTHGWKKYNWQKVVDKNSLKPEMLDNYISLSVNYKQKNYALPKEDALNLIINNKTLGKQFYNLKPINQTAFKKTDLVFFDSVKVSYQMDKNKELINYLTISRDDMLKLPFAINALQNKARFTTGRPVTANDDVEPLFTTLHNKFNDVQTLKKVVVRSRYKANPQLERIDELDKFYTTGMFSGTVRGYQLNVIDDTLGVSTSNNLQDYMRYRIPGMIVANGRFVVKAHDLFKLKDTLIPILTFIDEVELDDQTAGDAVQLLNMLDVAYVKYITGIAIGAGFSTTTGAIYIYTKRGNEKGPPAKGLPFVYMKGYNSPKEFISPDYRDKDLLKEPDLRTTLYWNPNIILDKINNKVKIEYYNNDVSKKLLLTIEGVNEKGKLIHIEKVIE